MCLFSFFPPQDTLLRLAIFLLTKSVRRRSVTNHKPHRRARPRRRILRSPILPSLLPFTDAVHGIAPSFIAICKVLRLPPSNIPTRSVELQSLGVSSQNIQVAPHTTCWYISSVSSITCVISGRGKTRGYCRPLPPLLTASIPYPPAQSAVQGNIPFRTLGQKNRTITKKMLHRQDRQTHA